MSPRGHEISELHDYVDALLEGLAVADLIVDSLPPDDVELVACHPEITWAVLARQPDRDAAILLLEHRFQYAFMEGEDAMVSAELRSAELLRDALLEPALVRLAMRAVCALAWTEPGHAMQMHRRYHVSTFTDRETEAVYEMCRHVLGIAPAWRRLANLCPVPRALIRFLRLQWVVSSHTLDRLIDNLRRDMTRRPGVYLDVCDCMAEHHEPLLRYLRKLTDRLLPEGMPQLGELGDEECQRLEALMDAIDAPMRRGLRLTHIAGLALTLGALLSIGGFDAAGLGASALVGLFGIIYVSWTARDLYDRMVRPHLAEYLAMSGTPTGCVVDWLARNQKSARRVQAFDVRIDTDKSLELLARLGRVARARVRAKSHDN